MLLGLSVKDHGTYRRSSKGRKEEGHFPAERNRRLASLQIFSAHCATELVPYDFFHAF